MRFDIPYNQSKKSGIYAIVNEVNAKVYIGSAVNLYNRFHHHVSDLNLRRHVNSKLTKAVKKYGIENFKFTLMEVTASENLIEREQFYLDKFDCIKKGYNIVSLAGSQLGFKHSEETKLKLSKIVKERLKNPNYIEKIAHTFFKKGSSVNTGRKATEEKKAKLRLSHLGIKPSAETIAKMAEARKGKKLSEQTKEKISAAHTGKKHSDARIEKNRIAKTGLKQSIETVAKRVASNIAKWKTKEHLYYKICVCETCQKGYKKRLKSNQRFCSKKCQRLTPEQRLVNEGTIRKALAAQNPGKPIIQYSPDGTLLKQWTRLSEIGQAGFNKTNVQACAAGRRKICQGFVWKYAA